MGYFLSLPERLAYVRVLVLREERDKVLSSLQKEGLIHLEPIGKIKEKDKEALLQKLNLIKEIRTTVEVMEKFFEQPIHIELKEGIDLMTLDEQATKSLTKIKELHTELRNLTTNLEKLNEDLMSKKKILNYLTALLPKVGDYLVKDLTFTGNLLYSFITYVKKISFPNLERSLPKDAFIIASAELDEGVVAVVAGMLPTKEKVMKLLSAYKAEIISLPEINLKVFEFLDQLKEEITRLEQQTMRLNEDITRTLRKSASEIAVAKVLAEIYGEKINALLNAAIGDHLTGIEGWIPSSEILKLNEILSETTLTYFVSEVNTNKEPPTKLRNSGSIKLFELITKLYGVPSYNEWDPTPIIMYSFMIFFGSMFGDVIYGLLMLVLIKYVLERTGLVDNPYSEGYLTLKKLLLVLSISSITFGALSNSFAGFSIVRTPAGWSFTIPGNNEAIPSLLVLSDPIWFLKYALIVGLIHINIGHAISAARAIKEHNKGTLIVELGIFIGEAFGIPYILHTTLHYDMFPINTTIENFMLYASLAGLVLIILGTVKAKGGAGVILWLFSVTGLLGDVLSYSRLAGLGLATYMMAKSFNSLAIGLAQSMSVMIPMAGIVAGIALGGFIMLAMNLITIIFGIIGAFVHSLRLCFVEFLPKWYEGEGREFTPFKAIIPKHIIIGRQV